ncbi:MAG: protein phosphatase [Desulfuromonas sp.]|nr:MAG: protein phosphatase [Desulfuromonas sp.]
MPKVGRLEKILELSRLMVASVDLDSLLQVVIDSAIEVFGAERASILLFDATSHELVSRVASGEQEIRFPADRGIAGATIASKTPQSVADAYQDPRFNPEIDKKTGFTTRNLLSLPLLDVSGDIVGVLQVLNKLEGTFGVEDEWLGSALAAQAGVCLQRARLLEHYHEKREMERAMEIAREIQHEFLPRVAPDVPGYDIAGVCEPADKAGGDLFDYIPVRDGRWLIVVADASGHGIGPALVAAETRAILRTASAISSDPCTLLEMANRLLAEDLDGRFVTCFVGLLDPLAHTLSYASAGHGPIVNYHHAEDRFRQDPATALPLGILAHAERPERVTCSLQEGDFMLIPTDGCFEMTNPGGEMYGTERLLACARGSRDASASEMLEGLFGEVRSFIGSNPQQDDCTAAVIKRSGTAAGAL